MPMLALLLALGSGCAQTNSVPASAPGYAQNMVGAAPETGSYVLYRTVGLDQSDKPTYEKVWSVSAQKGERLGFRWVTDEAHRWDKSGAFHLVAFADGDVRDLGPIIVRDTKYVWASADVDLNAYFHHEGGQKMMRTLTMQ
jgi:hypothetical protein